MNCQSIDLDYLNEMSGGDRELIIEMIDIFISEVPGYLSHMNESLRKKDWNALEKFAHKAKASASIMGLNKLAGDLKELELITGNGENIHLYPGYAKSIEEQFSSAIEDLKLISKTI